jgi:hypothetical protein
MTYAEKLTITLIVAVFTILFIAMTQNAPYRSALGDKINEGICHRMNGIYSTETGRCTKGETK